MAEKINMTYDKYGRERFTTPDSHMSKINSGNQSGVFQYQKGGQKPGGVSVDESQIKKSSGV